MSKTPVFPTASCFYAWAHSMLAHHGETDLIIAILKVRKDLQKEMPERIAFQVVSMTTCKN